MTDTLHARGAAIGTIVSEATIAACGGWSALLVAGQLLSIVDVSGRQVVGCLLYSADDPAERYSAPDTITGQGRITLGRGTVLRSNEYRPLMTIVADEWERHDTLGGACSPEANALRYGEQTRHHHTCVENFLLEGARWGLGARDLGANVNFFMDVPIDPDGGLDILEGVSEPGAMVTLRADRDVIVLLSACPQVSNPCNGFDPTPVRVVIGEPLTLD
jgi:uncharacterized protein